MEKNKILGIISIILCIIGWILYSKIGIILAILIEIGALILAIYSGKKQKNIFATIRNGWSCYFNCNDGGSIIRYRCI